MRVITQKDLDAFATAAADLQDVCRRAAEAAEMANTLVLATAATGDIEQAGRRGMACLEQLTKAYAECCHRYEELALKAFGLKRNALETWDGFCERMSTATDSASAIKATWARHGIVFRP